MFDDVCMACGKQLDDGSLYCNERCLSADRRSSSSSYRPRLRSPSGSSASASSVFTSPYLNPNAPFMSEIPPLMLPKKRTSSSSASSAMTSEFEEEDRLVGMQVLHPFVDVKSEHVYRLPPLGVPEAIETTPIALSVKLSPSRRTPISALPIHFARRPAPADTRSIVPSMHLRPESRSQTQQTLTPSRTLSHRHSRSHDLKFTGTPTPVLLPKRNRASLPAYFSRLTLSAQVAPTPPTLSHVDVQVDAAADVLATPKASSRRVVSPCYGEGWGSPVMPMRVPMPMSRESSPLVERPRERGRSRGARRDSLLGSEQRVETERRGRSRVVTPRLHS